MQAQYVVSVGIGVVLINIGCGLFNDPPPIVIIDRPSMAVDEARERARPAFIVSGQNQARQQSLPNLAAADIPKPKSGLHPATAISILSTTQQVRLTSDTLLRPDGCGFPNIDTVFLVLTSVNAFVTITAV